MFHKRASQIDEALLRAAHDDTCAHIAFWLHHRAEDMGIEMQQEWVATLDAHTRDSHAALDGEKVDVGAKFSNGCRYPGDPAGAPSETYNCRCTLIAVVKGVDQSDAERRARDPITGKNEIVGNMTYKEWCEWKRNQDPEAFDIATRKVHNATADRAQFAKYRKRLGDDAPRSISAFQSMKYEDVDAYADLKERYRYQGRVPEATSADYTLYKAIKATGVYGTVRVPPRPVDVDSLALHDDHALRHGCTLEDAKRYVRRAKCSIGRMKWNGMHYNYYAPEGATYMNDINRVNAVFSAKDFDEPTRKLAEVIK